MILEKLAEMKLRGQELDNLGFVDDLLSFCAMGNSIEGEFPQSDDVIVLSTNGSELINLPVETSAHWKFRLICARLCELSNNITPSLGIFNADSVIEVDGRSVEIKAHNGNGKRFFSIKTGTKANHTSEGIRQSADGQSKSSM
jgi:hypothetical protein